MADLTLKKAGYIPVIQVLTLSLGALLCYLIAYNRGDVSIYLPFVSETGAFSPEKCIFSLSLIIGSFWGFIIIFLYFSIMRCHALWDERLFFWSNVASLAIGSISMLGLAGVAAFPMTTVFWAHLLFASMFFVGSNGYFILVTFITYKTEGKTKVFWFRASLSGAITIFLILIVILFPTALVRWHKHNDFIPALKTPDKMGFTLLILSSILEWSIVIIIMLFCLSFILDLKHFVFTISATSDKNPPVNEEETAEN